MKKVFLKSLLLLCALIVGSSSAWAGSVKVERTVSFTYNSSSNNWTDGITGTSWSNTYALHRWTSTSSDGVTKIYFGGKIGKQSSTLAIRYAASYAGEMIGNIDPSYDAAKSWKNNIPSGSVGAIPGKIKKIDVTCSNTRGVYICAGTSQIVGDAQNPTATDFYSVKSDKMTSNISASYNTDETSYKYFAILGGTSSYTGITNVVVTYVEEIPTYEVTISSTSDGSIIVKNGDDVVTSGDEIMKGTILTLTAAAGEGKAFNSWSVSGATPLDASEASTTITVGNSDITIGASFDDATTYPIHWSVNGNVIRTNNVVENSEIVFSNPDSNIPVGMEFAGWSEGEILTPQNSAPTYVTSAIATEEKTYYAVMAVIEDVRYEKVTDNNFDKDADYIIGGQQDASVSTIWYLSSYEKTDVNVDWGVCSTDPEEAIKFTLSGTASALVVKDESNNYLKGLGTSKFHMNTSSQSVYLETNGVIRASSSGYDLRHNYNGGAGGLRWYSHSADNKMNAAFYKVYPEQSYHFCTTVPDINVTPSSETGKHYATFFAPYNAKLGAGVKAYIGTYATNTLTLHVLADSETGTVIPANTPVVLKATSADAFNVVATTDEGSAVQDGTLLTANNLHGTLAATAAPANAYVLGYNSAAGQETGFYQFSGTIPANRAYLIISGGAAQAAGIRIVESESNATNVENIEANHEVVKFVENGRILILRDGNTYDALGRKIR